MGGLSERRADRLGRHSRRALPTDFLLDRIGQGATTAVPLVADMGDILGVRLGAGAEDTIAEARSFLRRRFPGLPQ